jgi:hypothetical protein
MKKYLLLVIVCFPYFSAGQGNLQFNQVLDFTNGTNYTVPAGKTFKVESVNRSQTTHIEGVFVACDFNPSYYGDSSAEFCYCRYAISNTICIGIFCFGSENFHSGDFVRCGDPYHLCSPTNSKSAAPFPTIQLPIWLKSGQQITIATGVGVQISGIEFNIAP